MAKYIPQPETYIYKEINQGKFKSVKHFELIKGTENPVLSTLINISKNQNCAKSMPDYWLRIREGKKWTKYITGLFKSPRKGVYKGDTNRKKNLLIFKFSEDGKRLTIDFYPNYYTNNITRLLIN